MNAVVSDREATKLSFDCENETPSGLFKYMVIDSDCGWGQLLCLTTEQETASFIANCINKTSQGVDKW